MIGNIFIFYAAVFKNHLFHFINRYIKGLYYVTMSSINKTNCGRRKYLADPRRRVKCPVGECDFTGRIDNAKAH